jgi:hypothetical protein
MDIIELLRYAKTIAKWNRIESGEELESDLTIEGQKISMGNKLKGQNIFGRKIGY